MRGAGRLLAAADREKLRQVVINLVENAMDALANAVPFEWTAGLGADPTDVDQILDNLLDNALKYLDAGRPGAVAITAETGPGVTVFSVRDNGRGIVKEDVQKVFELFWRSGKQDVRGDGMGLAYVKTLVRRHGGSIRCESEIGSGTTFTFTIATGIEGTAQGSA